jgi:carbonic anhydrase
MISAQEGIARLKEGNARFVASIGSPDPEFQHTRSIELAMQQAPFATILGCSDSRVPVEIVFDQGLGALFVIRVAGNIVAPSQVDTVEYASAVFGTPLVIVLGHSHCGAVTATVDEMQRPVESQSRSFRSLVDRIRPSVEELMRTELKNDREGLIEQSVRQNVRLSVSQLRSGSATLERLVRSGDVTIVGAEYFLETGVVEFFDVAGD